MAIDTTAHRNAQRRYRERLSGLGAPATADIQRALALSVRSACAHFVNTSAEAPVAWIVRTAARILADAGFTPSEISGRLSKALEPQFITILDGEFARVPDAEETADQDAEVSTAPGTEM